MRTFLAAIGALLAFTASCYGDEDDFAHRMAKHACKHQKKCARSGFDDSWDGDMSKCREDVAETISDWQNVADLVCDYDPDEGKTCGREARHHRRDCGEDSRKSVVKACEDVYKPCGTPVGLIWP